jgi:uncharacterized alkaline shock family protein YloU
VDTERHHTLPYPGYPEQRPPDRGDTWIADSIVAKVAAAAAREVPGVAGLRGSALRRGWRGVVGKGAPDAGVRVSDGTAAIQLHLIVHDGVSIPGVVDAVRERVTQRVEFTTGFRVTKVDVGVVDVITPESAPAAPAPGTGAAPPAPA